MYDPDPQAEQGEPDPAGGAWPPASGWRALIDDPERHRTSGPGRASSTAVRDGDRLREGLLRLRRPAGAARGLDLDIRARARSWRWSGPSGAGKSTLVNLLPRFFDPDAGRRDDRRRRHPRPERSTSLRALIGIVTQDTVLFNDTVAQQHRLRPLRPAARAGARGGGARAYADEFIMQLPAGLRHGDRRVGRCASPAASGSAWRSPARCSRTRRS